MNLTISSSLKNKKEWPALSENSFLRYFNFIALYFAQGVPEGMAYIGIPAWMAMNGKTPGQIAAFVAACGIPWSFKIVVAPMMDRFTYLPMGRKRPWVIFGQLGLVVSFIAMAFVPDPLNNLNLFMAAGFTVGFFGAFQDVATDGMAIDIIPFYQQARANGLMWGSKIIGTSVSLALGSWLLNKYGYTAAILMLSVIVCLIMPVPFCLRERPGEKLLPWTVGLASPGTNRIQLNSWSVILTSLYKVFTLKNSLLLAVMLFFAQGAYNYMDTLLTIFAVQELGWTNLAYSKFFATANLVGGISGMLIGGFLLDKFGKIRMLNIYFFLLILLTAGLAFIKTFWASTFFIGSFLVIYQVLYVFSCIGVFATAMQCCWIKISASQFTLYMTISNIGRIALVKLIGPLKDQFNWGITLFAFAIMIAIAWVLMQFLNINHQVNAVKELENRDVEKKVPAMASKK